MEIIWILGLLFLFVTLVFVGIALAFPEWVGITGAVAKEFERQQRGEPSEPAINGGEPGERAIKGGDVIEGPNTAEPDQSEIKPGQDSKS